MRVPQPNGCVGSPSLFVFRTFPTAYTKGLKKSAFDYILTGATGAKRPLRRRLLRLLNQARAEYDRGTGILYLTPPTPNPDEEGKILVLRPSQQDEVYCPACESLVTDSH